MIDLTFNSAEEIFEFSKIELFKKMNEYKVNKIKVTFDGCGDSGGIEDIVCDNTELVSTGIEQETDHAGWSFLNTKATVVHRSHFWRDGGFQMQVNVDPEGNVRSLIEEMTYHILEAHMPGWEINSGSFGTLEFLRGEEKVTLEFNERIEEIDTTTAEF
jgi:hypothetical protein